MLLRTLFRAVLNAADGGNAAGGTGGAGGGAGAGSGSGNAGSGAGSGAAGGGSAAAGGSGGGAATGGSSALSQGSGAGGQDWLPEKFRVLGADGKVDVEGSARKLATEGYAPLEKRAGGGGLPPAKVEDYKLVAPEGLEAKAFETFSKDPATLEFIKEAHAKGFSNDQLNFALHRFVASTQDLAAGGAGLDADAVITGLKSNHWKDDAAFKTNMGHSYRAANALAGKLGMSFADIEKSGLGNNELFIRMMAALGPEISEDVAPNTGASGGNAGRTFEDQVAEITKQLEQLPQGDPKREKLLEQKTQLYERKYGRQQPTIFTGKK